MKTVYYSDHAGKRQPGFRGHAEAWWVRSGPNHLVDENFGTFEISEYLYEGLFNLGIVEAFQYIPNDGLIDAHEEGTLFNSGLTDAAKVVNRVALNLSDEEYDWHCGNQILPDQIEYRIVVDPIKLRHELQAFAEFITAGVAQGYDLQLWL